MATVTVRMTTCLVWRCGKCGENFPTDAHDTGADRAVEHEGVCGGPNSVSIAAAPPWLEFVLGDG